MRRHPLDELSRWERFKRWWQLQGGAYKWPNGHYELDFEYKAGIDPFIDSEDVKELKLQRYYAKEARGHKVGIFAIGVAVGAVLTRWLN